jgi:hypothetical protein
VWTLAYLETIVEISERFQIGVAEPPVISKRLIILRRFAEHELKVQ